jgi:hypothetical protein
MLPTTFQIIWESGFRVEDFLEINQSETRIVCGGQNIKKIMLVSLNLLFEEK